MCCDGSLFASVTLTDPSEADTMRGHRIPVYVVEERLQFTQPCDALCGDGCSIYADRPLLCGTYRCSLLRRVEDDGFSLPDALDLVRQARRRESALRELLSPHVVDDGSPIAVLGERFQATRPGHPRATEVADGLAEHRTALAEHFDASVLHR